MRNQTGDEGTHVGAPVPALGQAHDDPSKSRAQQPAEQQRQHDEPDLNHVVERQHVGVEPAFQTRLELQRIQPLGKFVHEVHSPR